MAMQALDASAYTAGADAAEKFSGVLGGLRYRSKPAAMEAIEFMVPNRRGTPGPR